MSAKLKIPTLETLSTMGRLTLDQLRDAPKKQAIRVGRGQGSGHGRACGRGNNGQKVRHRRSQPHNGFAGGQTPFHILIPKHGQKKTSPEMEPLNLGRLQLFIDQGRINPKKPITMKTLFDSGFFSRIKHGVKLLAGGAKVFQTPVKIEVSQASERAIEVVERLGGKVTCRYYNNNTLRAHLKPEKYDVLPRNIVDLRKHKLYEYYHNPEKRGYLADPQKVKEIRATLFPQADVAKSASTK
eukprot:Colp12_sorted_trinity150504_noHs@29729